MSDNNRPGSILRNLHRPSLVSAEAEQALLGQGNAPPARPQSEATPTIAPRKVADERTPTVPVTFHLPVQLRDQLRRVALARNQTMVNLVRQQLEHYLAANPLTEEERNRLLGL